jgi:Family of unknown function (DUF5317)
MTATMMSPGRSAAQPQVADTVEGMLLSVLAIAVGCVAGLAAGGSWRNAARTPLRGVGLLLGGTACEAVAGWWASGWVGFALVIAGLALLLGFAACNLRVTGMVLVAAGLLSNLTVIAINGGMPVRGVPAAAAFGPRHHGLRAGDHLTGLADVVHVAFLGQTISAGDIVLAVGVATVIVALLRPGRRPERGDSPVRTQPWTS